MDRQETVGLLAVATILALTYWTLPLFKVSAQAPTITDANQFFFGGNVAPIKSTCPNQLEIRIDSNNNVFICSPKNGILSGVENKWTKITGAALQ